MARYRQVNPAQSFPDLEQGVLERWRERDVFHESIRRREGAEPFVFYEGPPTANGRPGSHHVLARVFKDVFPRYQTMRGHFVPRKAGWDCHGLPVELEVEKELGFEHKNDIEAYGVDKFNAKCRESVLRYIDEWNELTERIGFWVDTGDAYYTLTNEYVESVWWSLKEVWERGLLTEGYKVVPYCTRCGTALSSHELAMGYQDRVDPSVYVRFPLKDEPGTSFLGWTTTPWTLLSNAALAVNADVTYAYVRVGDETLVVAEPLVERVLGEGADVVKTVKGADLEGTRYEPPFPYIADYGPRGHTVLPADFVTTEDGTGVVHTAIAFGEDDFRLGEEYGITVQNPVRPDGTFDERIEEFAGRNVHEAAGDIIASLERRGRLFRSEEYEHAYPHCWRCGTPLIYYAKTSWYARTTEVKDELLAANESINWYPDHIKHGRFGKWLENNVDWALSRERYWGTPLPVWRCGDDGSHVVCVGSLAEIAERGGNPPEDLHRPYIDEVVLTCEECGGEMRRVPDLIDVWWDSGCMPFAQWHAPFENEDVRQERFPADYICEGLDQTRGWFYSLLAVSVLLGRGASYRTCLCLGLILDPDGQKMSKSKGNVVVPWDVLSEHGADAFRWYYFTSKQPWDGYLFSLDTVGESVRQFLKPLWNTYAFYVQYANLASEGGSTAYMTELDHWILSRLSATTERVVDRMNDYDTTFAGRAIAEFVDDLSNWYVRLSRRRFWRGDDPAAFDTLRECLLGVVKLLAPLTPFVTDEIYDNLDGSEPSVHLCDFPEPGPRDEDLEWRMGVVRDAVELGRAARGHAKMKMRQPLREAVVVAADRERQAIEGLEQLLRDELNVKSVRYVSEADELGRFELKPNYRTLGPRFGKQMPQVAAAVAALDPGRLRDGGRAGINLEGKDHEIGPDDVTIVLQPLEGYQVERSGTHAVALNLELDDELRREGLAREVVHAVQAARKNAGLDVEDRIALGLAGDEDLLAAAREHEDYVTGETLATSLEFDGSDDEAASAEIEGRRRQAVATGRALVSPQVIDLLRGEGVPKGDALAVARLAGIMGAKQTPALIPLCHPLAISGVTVDLAVADDGVDITATVRTTDRTGVEMEALTAVSVAALTVIDMVKAVDKGAVITDVRVESKTGGKSGDWRRP